MPNSTEFPPQHQDSQPGQQRLMQPAPESLPADYKPAGKLEGKSALITGGDSGIGRAVCLLFALEGASVAFTYVQSKEDADARDTLRLLAGVSNPAAKQPLAIPTPDAGREENCREFVEAAAAHFGGTIDILVNNAAEQHVSRRIEDVAEEQLEAVFRTNFFSYFYATKFAIGRMKEGGERDQHCVCECLQGSRDAAGLHGDEGGGGGVHAGTGAAAGGERDKGERGGAGARVDPADSGVVRRRRGGEFREGGADGEGGAAWGDRPQLCLPRLRQRLFLYYGTGYSSQWRHHR